MNDQANNDWLDELIEDYGLALATDGKQGSGRAATKTAIAAHIAANYVPRGEHEQAMDDQLEAQKAMYTEAEMQERVAAENKACQQIVKSLFSTADQLGAMSSRMLRLEKSAALTSQ